MNRRQLTCSVSDYYSITSQTAFQVTNLAYRTSGQSWIVAMLSSTSTPAILTVGVNPVGLAVVTYAGTVDAG